MTKLKTRKGEDGRGADIDPEQARWAADVKERLYVAWTSAGHTQNSFARAIGRGSSALSVKMNSGSLDNWWDLVKISQVLDVSIDELLGIGPHKRPIASVGADGVDEIVTALREALERATKLKRRVGRVQARQSVVSRKQ